MSRWAFAVAAASALLAGCHSDDVGQPCNLTLEGSGCSAGVDYFESSATSTCDNLVCIHSGSMACPPSPTDLVGGACSKPCVSDSDCGNRTVCRQIVLDTNYINSLPPNLRQIYLGQIQSSNFCAFP